LLAPPPPCLPPLTADPESRIAGLFEVKRTSQYNNFIAKNWRGEYPLWVTYWIFNLLGSVILFGIASVAGEALFANAAYEPRSVFAAVSFVWLGGLTATIWQLVAVWRSANRRIQERQRIGKGAPWAELAKGAVILGVLQLIVAFGSKGLPQLTEISRVAFMDDPSLPAYSIRIMRNGTEAEITGGFKYGLTDDFLKILRASPQIKVVHLNSLGGRIGEAESLNKVIRGRSLITYTSYRCFSACTIAFAGGRARWVHSRAKLGFHGPAFPGMSDADIADNVKAQKEIFINAGFEARFVNRALATPNEDMWIPSLDELRDANVITNISNGSDFAASGFGGACRSARGQCPACDPRDTASGRDFVASDCGRLERTRHHYAPWGTVVRVVGAECAGEGVVLKHGKPPTRWGRNDEQFNSTGVDVS
jgi:hypothetical protein